MPTRMIEAQCVHPHTFSISGLSMRHGPHQTAKTSRINGSSQSVISFSSSSAVTCRAAAAWTTVLDSRFVAAPAGGEAAARCANLNLAAADGPLLATCCHASTARTACLQSMVRWWLHGPKMKDRHDTTSYHELGGWLGFAS